MVFLHDIPYQTCTHNLIFVGLPYPFPLLHWAPRVIFKMTRKKKKKQLVENNTNFSIIWESQIL